MLLLYAHKYFTGHLLSCGDQLSVFSVLGHHWSITSISHKSVGCLCHQDNSLATPATSTWCRCEEPGTYPLTPVIHQGSSLCHHLTSASVAIIALFFFFFTELTLLYLGLYIVCPLFSQGSMFRRTRVHSPDAADRKSLKGRD